MGRPRKVGTSYEEREYKACLVEAEHERLRSLLSLFRTLWWKAPDFSGTRPTFPFPFLNSAGMFSKYANHVHLPWRLGNLVPTCSFPQHEPR